MTIPKKPIHPAFLESDSPRYYSRRCWDMAVQKAVIFLNHNGFSEVRFKVTKDAEIARLFFQAIGLQPPTGEPVHRLMDLYLQDLWMFYAYDWGFSTSEEWVALREKVFERDGRVCAKCGCTEHLHIDHIKPKSLYPGLRLDISNMQVLCAKCNLSKGNRHTVDYTKRGVAKVAVKAVMDEYVEFFKGPNKSKRLPGQRKALSKRSSPYIKYALFVLEESQTPRNQWMPWFFTEQNGVIRISLLGTGQFDKFKEMAAEYLAARSKVPC